jgi:hypothetical protein
LAHSQKVPIGDKLIALAARPWSQRDSSWLEQGFQKSWCQIQIACVVAFSRDAAATLRITPDTLLYATTQTDFAAGVQASFNPCSNVHSKAEPNVS